MGDENLSCTRLQASPLLHLTFNKSKPPFDNQKVREAIAKAVNKNDIIAASYDNAGALANAPLNSLQLGYTEDLPLIHTIWKGLKSSWKKQAIRMVLPPPCS